MSKQQHFDEIFPLLHQTLDNQKTPVLSRSKWEEIPHTPFTVLISCILSLRTKDEVTDEASVRLLKDHDTPEKLIQLANHQIETLIYPVGFYKTKAKRIKELTHALLTKYDGNVPDDFDELLQLNGVGRKTANIVMVYGHYKHNYLPIDTHCHRIPNRIGWITTKNPEETEYALKKRLPNKHWDDFNHLFVTFGQTICVPISPFCSRCPIEHYCQKIGVTRSR